MSEKIGRRQTMEDVSKVVPLENGTLFCLFDGHGGREAAEFAAANLPKMIEALLPQEFRKEEAFVKAFRRIQAQMMPTFVFVGTTAALAYIYEDGLITANVGDTRVILSRNQKAVRLTVDHKPDLPEETAYINAKGGCVRDGRIGGMLAVSRALGDAFLGEPVNPCPYVSYTELGPNDDFLIIACDGVWDVMEDQEAVDLVLSEINPHDAALKIRDRAYDNGSTDNISVIVVFLNNHSPESPTPPQ